MNILKSVYFYVVLSVVIVLGSIGIALIAKPSTIKMEVEVYGKGSVASSGCVSVLATDIEGAYQYSFDNGKTWQKNNYGVIYQNGEFEILARNEKGKIVAKKKIEVDTISEDSPIITLDFDKKVTSTEKNELLKGVRATYKGKDISNKIAVDIVREDNNSVIVNYSVVGDSGRRCILASKFDIITQEEKKEENETSKIVIEAGNVYFEEENYKCREGEKISTIIKADGKIERDGNVKNATISSFSSSDNSIASVEKSSSLVNCSDCVEVQITCKKAGNVTLNATSSTGGKGSASLTVEKTNVSSIAFKNSNYSCNAGETISTIINTIGERATISSFTSSDSSVAIAEQNKDAILNCSDCIAVRIICKKAGAVTLSATSSLGATASSEVEVRNNVGRVYYDKTSYSCTVGEKITATITAEGYTGSEDNPTFANVSSYSSSDTSIATVEKHPTVSLRCANCVAVQITCKKSGSVTLNATSSLGAKGSAKVTVKQDVGKIYYDKSSYNCTAGEKITATITAEGYTGSGDNKKFATVSSYSSSNTSIATVEKHPTVSLRCANCVAVQITCKKGGTVTLNATSSLGAKGSAKVVVKENVGTVYYDKENYNCNVGEKITALIHAASGVDGVIAHVAGSSSSDTSIAMVEAHPTLITNCSDCIAVQIVCKKAGSTTLNATSSLGAKGSSKVVVTENVGTVYYDKASYSCTTGEKITTLIHATSGAEGVMAHVSKYSSNDTSIAIVEPHPTLVTNCIGCVAVQITCNKKGSTTLNATSSLGAKGSAKVVVKENVGTVYYDKENYNCNVGEKITALIHAASGAEGVMAHVSKYSSNDTSIAIVEPHPTLVTNCIGCVAVQITCNKKGSTTLNATSSLGAKGSSKVVVTENVGTVYYDKASYSCTTGEKITTLIHATSGAEGVMAHVSKYSSNDTSIAIVEPHPTLVTNCIDCVVVQITCKKKGNTTINATSTLGAKGSSKVSVTK